MTQPKDVGPQNPLDDERRALAPDERAARTKPLSTHHDPRPPKTFDEFYEEWAGQIRGYCAKAGFVGHELDDLVQNIIVALVERRVLERFDPTCGSFETWVWAHVKGDAASRRRYLDLRREREVRLDASLDEERGGGYEDHLGADEPGFSIVECNDVLESTMRRLPKRQRKLFREMVNQFAIEGEVNIAELARLRGVKRWTLHEQIENLRADPAMRELKTVLHAVTVRDAAFASLLRYSLPAARAALLVRSLAS